MAFTTSLPPKYSWLGAIELPTELSSGVVAMGARSYQPELPSGVIGARSYVPQIGRFLPTDWVRFDYLT